MTANNKLALSIKELIALSGVGRTTIYKEIKERRLIAHKLHRRTLILFSDVEQWLGSLPVLGTKTA